VSRLTDGIHDSFRNDEQIWLLIAAHARWDCRCSFVFCPDNLKNSKNFMEQAVERGSWTGGSSEIWTFA